MHNTSLFDFPRINLQHLLKSDPDYKQPLYFQGSLVISNVSLAFGYFGIDGAIKEKCAWFVFIFVENGNNKRI